jgi:hypothetical protein
MKRAIAALFAVMMIVATIIPLTAWQNTPTVGVLPDSGPSLPATCVVGQIYFKTTATVGLNQCATANTWTAVGGGGATNSCGSPTCTVSTAGSGNGVLSLTGNTSGAATLTTSSTGNAATFGGVSPFQLNIGTASSVGGALFLGASVSQSGLVLASGNNGTNGAYLQFNLSSTAPALSTSDIILANSTAGFGFNGWINRSGSSFAWVNSNTTANGTVDTALSRSAAGVITGDTGTLNNAQARLRLAGVISSGTTFTSSGGCTEGTLTGGATAGKFTTSGSTSCTTTVTFGNTATSTTGWSCWTHDLTTATDYNNPHVTSSTTTTVVIATGTIVSGDVIEFGCIGY